MRRLLLPFLLVAAAFGDELDILEGFDEAPAVTIAPPEKTPEKWAEIKGALTLQGAYNTAGDAQGYDGLSRLKLKGDLELRKRLDNRWQFLISGAGYLDAAYALNDRDNYTDEVLDEMESELELREAYAQGPLSKSWDLKIGRQIVVWGKSDNLRVADMLNPLDMREPGMTDIEDLRLPVAMVKLDYYAGPWNLSLIALPETRFSKRPAIGSDFSLGMDDREYGGDHDQFAAALRGHFTGWDLSFYGASLYRDEFNDHEKIEMAGLAANRALGNWLLKGEAAHLSAEVNRLDLLGGAEYQGVTDTTLSLEVASRDYEDQTQTAYTYALRATRNLLHERANVNLLAMQNGKEADEGGFVRFWGEYDLKDALTLKAGYVDYQGGEMPFEFLKDNDRLFAELKASF
ncbi:MAG: DUF1302 domain-containing protein [Campylobacterales bacterium]